MNLNPAFVTIILSLMAAACTVGPDYHPPVVVTPTRWMGTLPQSSGVKTAGLANWWKGFQDKKLTALIERSLQGNLDLKVADARLAASRAQISSTSAGLWPRLNASGGYQRERLSPNALKGILGGAFQSGESSSSLLSSMGPIGTPFNLFQAGFDSSWELDLFGGIKRQQEAAMANAEAVEENRRDIAITLAAEVARNYLELIGLQRRLEIARQRLENQRKIFDLAAHAYHEGFASALDVKRSKTDLEVVEATIPSIDAQIKNTRHGLALLLGLQPVALEHELANLKAEIPQPPTLPAGTPLDLLRRRPDIRKAERTVAAANAMVGAAMAELFPKITLTGAVGLQSQSLGD